MHRWIASAPDEFRPQITCELDSNLRYLAVDIHDPDVPLVLPTAQLLTMRVPDVFGSDFTHQFASAVQRAICLNQPQEIRYRVKTHDGRLLASSARIKVDRQRRRIIAEILRFGCAVAVIAS